MDEVLFDYLKQNKIEYRLYTHPPMFRVSDEAKIKSEIAGAKSKNLFMKDENNRFYLITWYAYSRLPVNKLKKLLKIKSLEFASPEELKDNLSTTPGSVSIFAMLRAKPNISLLIDRRLYSADFSCYHPNENTSTLSIPKKSLHKFLDSLKIKFQVIDIQDE